MMWNSLATWLEGYLGEVLSGHPEFTYSPGAVSDGSGVLISLGYMPEAPEDILVITGYDYPENTIPGSVSASVQVRGRATSRARATNLVESACKYLVDPSNTSRLDRVSRINLQPIGQDQMGNHEVTANLFIETIERTD